MSSWLPGKPLYLETKRFYLRSLNRADATDRYLKWAADPEIMNPLNTPAKAVPREELIRYIEGFNNDSDFLLGIFDRESGLYIGFFAVNVDKGNRAATTNVVVGDKAWWGKRVVLEARAAILDFLFDVLKVDKVNGIPFATNHPAVYNYKAQGFVLEGMMRQHRLAHDGKSRLDQCQFGLLRSDWQQHRGKDWS
jgi:RimJ/RimL family protein N-acetyltransferase